MSYDDDHIGRGCLMEIVLSLIFITIWAVVVYLAYNWLT